MTHAFTRRNQYVFCSVFHVLKPIDHPDWKFKDLQEYVYMLQVKVL